MVIAGIVYAEDCATPLAEVLVEIWAVKREASSETATTLAFAQQTRTDAQGRYKFIIQRERRAVNRRSFPLRIQYRVSYPQKEPAFAHHLFGGDLHLTSEPFTLPSFAGILAAQRKTEGGRQPGRFDIILPIRLE